MVVWMVLWSCVEHVDGIDVGVMNVGWADGAVIWCGMRFCVVIRIVVGSFVPVDSDLFFSWRISEPVETHVPRF